MKNRIVEISKHDNTDKNNWKNNDANKKNEKSIESKPQTENDTMKYADISISLKNTLYSLSFFPFDC